MDQAQEFYNRGIQKAQEQDYQGAVGEFGRALRVNPLFADAYYKRGNCHFDLGDHTLAIADYTQALQIQPNRSEIYLSRGFVQLTSGDFSAALADSDRALSLNPNLAQAHSLRGTAYNRLGNFPEAIANFKEAAKLYLAQKDKVNCQRCIDSIDRIQAEQNHTKNQLTTVSNFFSHTLVKVQRGDYRGALEDLNWLIKTNSQDAQTYCYRGIVLGKLGYQQDAIKDLNKSLQLNAHNPQTYCYRAMVRIDMGDLGGAIADCHQALQIDPNYTEAYIYRGNAHQKFGNYRLAIEDYSRVLQVKSDNPQAYYQRAAARLDFEDRQGAIEDYQKAANIFFNREDWTNYREALDNIKKIQSLPKALPKENSVNKKLFDFESALNSEPIAEVQDQLLRMVGGNWDIAERLVDIARQKQPGMPEEWYWKKAIHDLERDR